MADTWHPLRPASSQTREERTRSRTDHTKVNKARENARRVRQRNRNEWNKLRKPDPADPLYQLRVRGS